MTVPEAISDFRAAANAKAEGVIRASEDHALHARLARAFCFLSSQGEDGLMALRTLLHDSSPYVRAWAAAHFLSLGDRSAIPVMEQLATAPSFLGFIATITLKEFHAGRLRSPFNIDA